MKPCSLAEYKYYESERVLEEDLSVDGLYLIMLALKARTLRHEAFKVPGLVADVNQDHSGLYRIRFNLLDDDLTVRGSSQVGSSENGYLTLTNLIPSVGYFRERQNAPASRMSNEAQVPKIEHAQPAVPIPEPIAA